MPIYIRKNGPRLPGESYHYLGDWKKVPSRLVWHEGKWFPAAVWRRAGAAWQMVAKARPIRFTLSDGFDYNRDAEFLGKWDFDDNDQPFGHFNSSDQGWETVGYYHAVPQWGGGPYTFSWSRTVLSQTGGDISPYVETAFTGDQAYIKLKKHSLDYNIFANIKYTCTATGADGRAYADYFVANFNMLVYNY
jgi:hypothetical protein